MIIYNDKGKLLCFVCKKEAVFRCSTCASVNYCSSACQGEHWRVHQKNCQSLPKEVSELTTSLSSSSTAAPTSSTGRSTGRTGFSSMVKPKELPKEDPFSFSYEIMYVILKRGVSINEKITMCYNKILPHRENVLKYMETVNIAAFFTPTKDISYIYYSIEKYFLHYFLLIRLYLADNQLDKAKETFQAIYREFDNGPISNKLNEILKKLIDQFKKLIDQFKKLNSSNRTGLFIAIQVYLSYIKFLSVLIKYGHFFKLQAITNNLHRIYMTRLNNFLTYAFKENKKDAVEIFAETYFAFGIIYAYESRVDLTERLINRSLYFQKIITPSSTTIINCYYNNALISYVMGDLTKAKNYINEAFYLRNNFNEKEEKEQLCTDEQLMKLYIVSIQIEMEKDNYREAWKLLYEILDKVEGINFGLNNLQEMANSDSKRLSSRESISFRTYKRKSTTTDVIPVSQSRKEIYGLFEKLEKEVECKPTDLTKPNMNKVLNLLADAMRNKKQQVDKETDLGDIKNFFLFLTKLSMNQLLILNDSQSKLPDKMLATLPLLFTKKFKGILNPKQRHECENLRTLSLTRNRVLKNYRDSISLENLNYKIFQKNFDLDDLTNKSPEECEKILEEIKQNEDWKVRLNNMTSIQNPQNIDRKTTEQQKIVKTLQQDDDLQQLYSMVYSHVRELDEKEIRRFSDKQINVLVFSSRCKQLTTQMTKEMKNNCLTIPILAYSLIEEIYAMNETLKYPYRINIPPNEEDKDIVQDEMSKRFMRNYNKMDIIEERSNYSIGNNARKSNGDNDEDDND